MIASLPSPAVANRRLSGENAKAQIACDRARNSVNLRRAGIPQARTTPSRVAVAKSLPSGEKARPEVPPGESGVLGSEVSVRLRT